MKYLIALLFAVMCIGCTSHKPVMDSSSNTQNVTAAGWESQTPMDRRLAGEKGAVIEASVRVQKVDLKNRLLTVTKADGASVTLKVDPEVKRLSELKPGDTVVAQYMTAVAYELREPTSEERSNPSQAVAFAERNQQNLPPGVTAGNVVHGIVTIEAIDRKAGTVTVKGPTGKTSVVKVERPQNFDRMKIGDQAAVTYVEAVALKVEPRKS